MTLAGCATPGGPADQNPAGTRQSTSSPASIEARCAGAALRINSGRLGEALGAHGDIEFTNTGSRPCVLSGLPAVTIVGVRGTPLPVRQVRAAAVQLRPVVLAPGRRDAADLVVFWANWCGRQPGQLRVRVTLPADGAVTGPFNGPPDYDYLPRCASPRLMSTVSVLDAYLPGPAVRG